MRHIENIHVDISFEAVVCENNNKTLIVFDRGNWNLNFGVFDFPTLSFSKHNI